ncbi:KRAB-A domain-containing 2-like [Brachionus plicatilis]|uniref:KRAB-A domain-containing 2-like n=1 Tax=Brachionus plicatilis TaxID=10195 RepID=A0A3M7SC48_BRAPC|nr:KRAB-A domain-containing 2-like [Brachionus plicatilis]
MIFPLILQMGNGKEFVELKLIWPNKNIANGKPRHPFFSRLRREPIKTSKIYSVYGWLIMTQNCSLGQKYVQMHKNNSYHSTIKSTTYYATFGRDAIWFKFNFNFVDITGKLTMSKLEHKYMLQYV